MSSTEDSCTWVVKYRPSSSKDIVGNYKAITSLKEWVTSFSKHRKVMLQQIDNNKNKKKRSKKTAESKTAEKKPVYKYKSCALVTGSHGVGKSVAVDIILREAGYTPQIVKFDSIKNIKDTTEVIRQLTDPSNIIDIMNQQATRKIAIVIDGVESVTSSTEKNCLKQLQKQNDTTWKCPIVFISNNKHNKLLSEIKKFSVEFIFWPPYDSDMRKILVRIVVGEKMNIKSEEVAQAIIEHAQSDIRRLIYTLQDLYYAYSDSNKKITMDVFKEYCEFSKQKDIDYDLYKATEGLLYNYKDIPTGMEYYDTEKVLLPLMIQQNYPQRLLTCFREPDKRYDVLDKISSSLSESDVIENYIYGDQNWNMQEIHGFLSCVYTSYHLCNDGENYDRKIRYMFPDDLNRTSIKNINKKNKANAERCFKNMNIFDCIYINKIIRKLISEDKIKECVDLMKGYDIQLEYIESLLKVDKIENSKPSLTSRQRKEFQQYLG